MQLLSAEGRALHGLLWRLTQRADVAEDLMQDLVVKLAGSATFAAADRPGAFARRAATNLALDWRRKQVRRGKRTEWAAVEHGLPGPADEPWSTMQDAEQVTAMLDALATLKSTDRLVLTMRYLEEADYDAVAEALGKTKSQTRGLCFKAIGRLRKQMAATECAEVKHDA